MTLTRESVLKLIKVQNHNGIDIEELPNIPKINLRGKPNNINFMDNIYYNDKIAHNNLFEIFAHINFKVMLTYLVLNISSYQHKPI